MLNCCFNLKIGQLLSKHPVIAGQGEYIVFHKKDEKVTKESFEKVYRIFNRYLLSNIIKQDPKSAPKAAIIRFNKIKKEIYQLDSSLDIAFVPRTLYEMIFIRKVIEEDLYHKKICSFTKTTRHSFLNRHKDKFEEETYKRLVKEDAIMQKKRKCWHLCCFEDEGNNNHPKVKEIAYRLNQVMVEKFRPSDKSFSFQKLSQFLEKEIDFLRGYYNSEEGEKIKNGDCPGPTTNFTTESTNELITPMGIRNDKDAQIIRKAMKLDCSQIARKSFLLFRGANIKKDSVVSKKSSPYSLSFGTSLFAGFIYDGGATAFYHMRDEPNGYAIAIPYDQLDHSPFYIPSTNTICQAFGYGEAFHSRTKVWKDYHLTKPLPGTSVLNISKMQMVHLRSCLTSNFAKDEFIEQFQKYKKKAIHLK